MGRHRIAAVLIVFLFFAGPSRALAVTIFESATNPIVGQATGYTLDNTAFVGTGFSVSQSVQVTHVGGHLLTTTTPDPTAIWVAIVSLSCASCAPVAPSLIPGAALASTTFDTGSVLSSDYLTPLSVTLSPGDYGLVFGGGDKANFQGFGPHFGSTGEGHLSTMNTGVSSFFYYNHMNGNTWNTLNLPLRVVVEGTLVPEPTTAVLLGLGLAGLCIRPGRSRARRAR